MFTSIIEISNSIELSSDENLLFVIKCREEIDKIYGVNAKIQNSLTHFNMLLNLYLKSTEQRSF